MTPVLKNIACLAIIALTCWLGGFGCALCCSTAAAETCCLNEKSTAGQHALPAGESFYGDTAGPCSGWQPSKRESSFAPGNVLSKTVNAGCSLLPGQEASLIYTPKTTIDVVSPSQAIHIAFSPGLTAPVQARSNVPLPANRGSTYLRCCVFLI